MLDKNKKRNIIIDTDPGIDDAIALAIASFSEEIDVKLITTVSGNVSLDYVTENTLKLLTFYNKDIPVAKGASGPLIRPAKDASNVHGKTGLEGYDFEEIDKDLLIEKNAVNAMYETIMKSPGKTTVVAIGPLTNIALLLKVYPEVIEKIEEIIFMGGAIERGNYGVYSEFNIGYDPEAAHIVLNSSVKTVMVGLDIALQVLILPEESEQIKKMNKVGEMFYSLFSKYRGGSFNTGLKMFDSTAIAYLLRPELFETVETYVGVELHGEYTAGATAVDLKGYIDKEKNCNVCLNIDKNGFKEWFLKSIEAMNI
jgi:non-specific riboncleoside hydrolase